MLKLCIRPFLWFPRRERQLSVFLSQTDISLSQFIQAKLIRSHFPSKALKECNPNSRLLIFPTGHSVFSVYFLGSSFVINTFDLQDISLIKIYNVSLFYAQQFSQIVVRSFGDWFSVRDGANQPDTSRIIWDMGL